MQIRVFNKDEVIFREGDIGTCLYEIAEGRVSVVLGYGTGSEQKLTELGKGRIFGEMAVLEAWPRSATVIALEDHTRVREISSQEVDAFFREDHAQIRYIMENLSHRLRELTEDYAKVCATIREMRQTRGEKGERKEGLLVRIGRYLNIYSHLLDSRRALEAMETYDTIEQIKGNPEKDPEGLKFDNGEVIFREGDPGTCMYYIGWGTVGIYSNYGNEDQKLLTTLQEDRFFGEMGLIEKLPRSATAVALENGTILTDITAENLDLIFEKSPEFIMRSLQHISSRLRQLTRDYVKACRTVSRMDDEEHGRIELSDEELQNIQYYMNLAQIQGNMWIYY